MLQDFCQFPIQKVRGGKVENLIVQALACLSWNGCNCPHQHLDHAVFALPSISETALLSALVHSAHQFVVWLLKHHSRVQQINLRTGKTSFGLQFANSVCDNLAHPGSARNDHSQMQKPICNCFSLLRALHIDNLPSNDPFKFKMGMGGSVAHGSWRKRLAFALSPTLKNNKD